jgi:hypothetical protein
MNGHSVYHNIVDFELLQLQLEGFHQNLPEISNHQPQQVDEWLIYDAIEPIIYVRRRDWRKILSFFHKTNSIPCKSI